jgi:hypothetical protein
MKSTRPTETICVPSLGLLYDGNLPEGKVEFHPMTAKEERILSGGFKDGNAMLDAVIKSCCPELPVALDDMLIADKYFILLSIRAFSYGSEYGLEIKCPDCSQKFRHALNLGFTTETDELEESNVFYIKTLEDDAKEPFEGTLPVSGDVIEFRLLRGKDEKAIAKYTEQHYAKRKVNDGNPSFTYRLGRHILTVNGEELSALDVRDYVENLIARDSIAFRDAIEKVDCGVDGTFSTRCPRCEEEIESTLTLGPEFFRPRY